MPRVDLSRMKSTDSFQRIESPKSQRNASEWGDVRQFKGKKRSKTKSSGKRDFS